MADFLSRGIITATDFLDKEIKVGDEVVFMHLKYRSLTKGKIVRLTDKMAFIEYKAIWDNNYIEQSKQFHNQLIKIE